MAGRWHDRRRAGKHNISVDQETLLLYSQSTTSAQFKKWLTTQGCSFAAGKGGHLKVRRDELISVLPMHGSNKELGKGLVERIKKDLGLK
jgi:mRNA interferase HicA